MDAEALIACSACARAKAKCDKRLPTCARCLFKRLKCEPRQPRRYPETFQLLHPQVPSLSNDSPSSMPSPQNQNEMAVDEPFHQLIPADMQWHHTPPITLEQHFDSSFLADANVFSPNDAAMDYDFITEGLGIDTPQSPSPNAQSGSVSVSGVPPALPTALEAGLHSHQATSESGAPDEDWPCFGCNPPTGKHINPKTGSVYLMRLEKTLEGQSTWTTTDFPILGSARGETIQVEPVHEGLRDKLMVISQGFFSRARDVHRVGIGEPALGKSRSLSNANFVGFFILPPAFVLEAFLRTYASRVEPYMPFFSGATIVPTKLIAANDEKASILLLLLMIAEGAMGSTVREAQNFASGLVETCRICIVDVMERNVQLSAHPVMLRCALLYLHASAWSGNRWHMDLSAAQLRMFISMLRYSRMLDTRPSPRGDMDEVSQPESVWRHWQCEETLNRLAYSWVLLDQEMNLFHDRQPDLDINELNAPMPDHDALWNAPTLDAWRKTLIDIHQANPPNSYRPPCSLATLFKQFMKDEIPGKTPILSYVELRLLLHPLQALIYHLNQSLMYFFNAGSQRLLQRLLTQLEEVQFLLKQWYTIANRAGLNDKSSNYRRCNMVMYHLTCLNTVAYFPDIERLARGETHPDTFKESLWTGKRCSEDSAQIWCHCGQVIRYFRQLPATARPYWWSASIYRVALYMWATDLVCQTNRSASKNSANELEKIAVDAHSFDHPSILRYLRQQDSIPTLSYPDGTYMSTASPLDIVKYCIAILEGEATGSRLDDGIEARLSLLWERWSTVRPSG